MGDLFDEVWEWLGPRINAALDDGHYLEDTPEVRAGLADADDLARRMDDD